MIQISEHKICKRCLHHYIMRGFTVSPRGDTRDTRSHMCDHEYPVMSGNECTGYKEKK